MKKLTTPELAALFDVLTEVIAHKHFICVSPLEKIDKRRNYATDRDHLFSAYKKLGGQRSFHQIIGVDK